MRKKYIISLVIICILMVLAISVGTSYSLWKIENSDDGLVIEDSNCVEIIYSDENDFNLINPSSTSDSDGPLTAARSMAVTNSCSSNQTVELSLNILNKSTIDTNKVKFYVNGDITVEPSLISSFKSLQNDDENIKDKKLIYSVELNAKETKRFNIRMWLDEDASTTSEKNTFYTNYYLSTSKQTVKLSVADKLLEDNGGKSSIDSKGVPDFSTISTSNDGLFNFNGAYYFRGSVDNNYLKIGDYLFRIVGINSDSSLKIVYLNNELYSQYNSYGNKSEHVSFDGSTINQYLSDWYNNNLSSYDDLFISYDFCNDTSYTKYFSKILYGSLNRVYDDNSPSLICGSGDNSYGGYINSKVGLLTADEIVLAGGNSKIANTNFYLYTGSDYYTMSPFYYLYNSTIFVFNSTGVLSYSTLNNNDVVLPVLNVSSSVNMYGSGTSSDPYTLEK